MSEDPYTLIFNQTMGLAYKYGVLQSNPTKAVDFLYDRLSADDLLKARASSYLQTLTPKVCERDFISKMHRTFLTDALSRNE